MLIKFINTYILAFSLVVLTSCFSESGSDSSGGKLFTGHKPATNLFVLNPNYAGSFVEGDKITLSLKHSFAVTVAGVPRIEIDLDGNIVFASYVNGSNSTTLNFEYIIQAADSDVDGASLNPNIDLNGGTLTFIEDSIVKNANLIFVVPSGLTAIVDTTAPLITALTPPLPKTYLENQNMQLVVNFDENVLVTGTPTLSLDLEGSIVNAVYFAGSGSSNLIFRYTVHAADQDLNGILPISPLNLAGATIKDVNGNSAALTFATGSIPTVLVDGSRPYITNVTAPVNNTYFYSENIQITFQFNNPVTVSGSPRVEFNVGGSSTYLDYLSGSGSSTLIFEYSVLLGDFDSDGVVLSNTIDLNGGSIIDAEADNAFLNFTSPFTPNVLVDAVKAKVVSIIKPADAEYTDAQELFFILNFDQNIIVTGAPRLPIQLTSGLVNAVYNSGSGTSNLIFKYTVQNADTDEDGITLQNFLDLNTGSLLGENNLGADLDITIPVSAINTTGIIINPASLQITSITPPANSTYIETQNIDFVVNINDIVNVAGIPRITLDIGGVTKYATYFSGTGSSALTFRYTVEVGLEDIDGITMSSPLDFNGGTIEDASLQSLDPIFISPDLSLVFVDSIAPSVTAISAPINKTWINGETLSFTLTYNEIVNVSGTPRLQLTIGGSSFNFDYVGGTGTTDLTFSYALIGSEEDLDGISFTSSLVDLNGGSIEDVVTNPSNLNLDANIALPNLSSVLVDAIIPLVTITSSPDITSANQNSYVISGTCSENSRTVSISIGGIILSPTCSSNSWSIAPTDVSALADSPAIAITADHDDSAGNDAIQATVNVEKSVATPLVAITSASNITQANHTAYSVSGTCSENGRVVSVMIGTIATSPNCSGGFWTTAAIDVSGEADSGAFPITADHDNAVAVPAIQASTTVVKDTIAPTVTISAAPAITTSNETNYMVSGTCSENGRTVDVYIDTLNFLPTCASGAWTTGYVDVSSLADDPALPITADHDNAGAVPADQASTTVVKSTVTPTVSVLSVPATLTNSADLTWTISDPGGYTLNDHIINYRIKGTPTWLTFDDGISVSNSTTVTGLNPSTTYEFRVALTYDITETSEFTNIAEGLTLPDDPLFDSPHKAMNVGGSTDTNVVAFYDNTRVYLNDVEIGASPLSKGQVVNLATARYDVIDADAPIYTAGELGTGNGSSGGNIVWNPTSWAGKTFNFSAIRTNPQTVWVYAIENSTIEVKSGATLLDTLTLTAGNTGTLSWSVYGSYQMISTGTVLAYHISGTGGASSLVDPKPLLPASLEIIGFPSNSMTLTTDTDATNYSLIHGNSATASGVINRADAISVANQGGAALYAGNSLIISADKKIAGYSYADSNGLCAAPFLPTNLMKKRYIINTNSDYVAFASKSAGTIDVYSPAQTIGVSVPVQVLTLTRSGANPNAPYNARVGTTTQGYRFVSTVPVAGWYQPDNSIGSGDDDETILYGTDL